MASIDYSSGGWSISRTGTPWAQMGTRIWSNPDDIFSLSRASAGCTTTAAADEEEALQWAALEKLPTYNRLRTGILRKDLESFVTGEGARKHFRFQEVDVTKMGTSQRQELIDRIFKIADDDNATFLRKLRDRIDKVDIQLPTVEVRFENLTVAAKCHVGSRALPTLFNVTANAAESIISSLGMKLAEKTEVNILKNVSGIISPSRMTLLLGPPSSGKTTLLLALAGKLDPTLQISGEIKYNGYKLSEFVPQKTAAYISQYDIHTGEMTVKETLNFSENCQGIGTRFELLSELSRREKARGIQPDPEVDLFMKATAIEGVQIGLQTDYTMKILGLDICADTIVGGEMQRGISGGQRKRVTIGEMIVGPTRTLFMDEISTGLDSSTTHQVVKCLQQIVHLGEATILMSLLQPTPETFDLFDDIILLVEGHVVYQGPREDVLGFFQRCGFQCPKRKGVADFLQEVTSKKDQGQYWEDRSIMYKYVSPADFAKYMKEFNVGKKLHKELSIPFDKRNSHGAALVFTKRSVPLRDLLRTSFSKEWLLIRRNSFVYIFRAIQLIILALITSTVFLRTNMPAKTEADGAVFVGALLFGMLVNFFNGFAEQAIAISRLPVFFKQRDMLLYPSWVFTLPNCIIRVPISIMESIVWVLVTYYTIGFAPEFSRFFKQLLIIILIQQMAAGLFRLMIGLTRSMTHANTWGSALTITLICVGGFVLPKDLLPKWWILVHWLSPLSHGFIALSVNEMLSPRWMDTFAPDGRRLGIAVLENFDTFTDQSWYWKSAAVLLGYAFLFNALFTLCLMHLNPVGKPNTVVSQEEEMEKEPTRAVPVENGFKEKKLEEEVLSWNDQNSCDCPDWRSYSTYKSEAKKTTPRRGMVLPFTSLAMSFKEVNYYVDIPPGMKEQGFTEDRLQLLRGISGAFRPGVLTALMGESGAGKTTLMDVLAGRKTGGYIEGDIRISGYPKKQSTFARISGYCEQFDVHSPQLTVRESLIFSALLRLSKDVRTDEKFKFVDEVMELIELSVLKDALVGIPGVTGLSVEQRKRLTIAVELVANPSIIFMDEPTSGLDARAAAIVMRAVRNTVNTGRTVVCTIHQPSIDIFESFDELLLLKRGGLVVYSGPLGQNSQKLIEYFEAIPGVQKIEESRNPSVWMLEATSVASEAKLGIDFAEIYMSSSLQKRNQALVKELSKPLPGSCDVYFSTQYAQSSLAQYKICLWKYWSIYWRNPEYNLSRLGMALVTALILGSIFWKIGERRNNASNLHSVIGAMYLAIQFVGFSNCSNVQPLVATERSVFYREKAAGMYSALPYAISQVTVEIPYVLFQSFYYTLILYCMMSFQWTAMKFLWFFLITSFCFLYYTYYGMLSVAVSPNLQVSGVLSASIFFLFDLFSGFFIPRPELPAWWVWFYWVCPVSWTLYGLIVTQYGDMNDIIKVPGQEDQRIRDYVMNHYGFRNDYQGIMIAVLMSYAILFSFMYTYCIRYKNFQKR
ncbi:Pleiotropic drug resistance protein 12 [Apostasia shenzhenica]|uniref:Pleiotropic drug resistance protein 12 n=1 Tax=Apostasia shenzhenica TaxID=1088818 RepID=A0A2I0BA41_9ASPA|nr:Pleiotropic drug resistance protein 12 [Apostasia shenzhenica]